jgi:hypothetical protein
LEGRKTSKLFDGWPRALWQGFSVLEEDYYLNPLKGNFAPHIQVKDIYNGVHS